MKMSKFKLNIIPIAVVCGLAVACNPSTSGGGGTTTPEETPSAESLPSTPPPPPTSEAENLTKAPLPPLRFTPTMSKSSLVVGDSVECVGLTSSPDELELTYGFSWFAGESPGGEFKKIDGASTKNLAISISHAHKFIKCVIEASDARGLSVTSDASEPATVANSSPSNFKPKISAADAYLDEELSCESESVDIDGDKISYEYGWQSSSDGNIWEDDTLFKNTKLKISAGLIGKKIRCVASASDSYARSEEALSDVSNVLNRPPYSFDPSVSERSPVMGGFVSCSATTTDPDGGDVSYSYRWMMKNASGDWTPVAGKNKNSITITKDLARANLKCEASATDINGGVTTVLGTSEINVQNSRPQQFTTYLSSGNGKVGDKITCRGVASDEDGDELAYERRWQKSDSENGVFIDIQGEAFETLTLVPELSRHWIRCLSTATDPAGASVESLPSVAIPVYNTAPKPFLTTIDKATAKVGDLIECLGTTTDQDSNPLSYTTRWVSSKFETGPFQIMNHSEKILPIEVGLAHKFIKCQRTADDSYGGVAAGDESPVTAVLNTEPEFFAADISSQTVLVGGSLDCSGMTTDSDEDDLAYTFVWYKSLPPSSTFTEISRGPTGGLDVTMAMAHHVLKCHILADDSFEGVVFDGPVISEFSPDASVLNTAPNNFSTSINATPMVLGDTAMCSGQTTDVDGDPVSYLFDWMISNSQTGPFSPLLTANGDSYGEDNILITKEYSRKFLKCRRTALDGKGGETIGDWSFEQAVLNTPPIAFSASISPDHVVVGDSASCDGNTSDDDGDSINLSYQWFKAPAAGGPYSLLTKMVSGTDIFAQKIIPVTTDVAHLFLKCSITADDGFGGVVESDVSNLLTVDNTRPADFTVSMSSLSIKMGESTSCDGTTTDIDLDTLTPIYEWHSSESANGPFEINYGFSGQVLTANQTVAHQFVRCIKRFSDGFGGITTAPDGPIVTIDNTAPYAFQATRDKASALVDETISCDWNTADADGDEVTLSQFQWFSSATQNGTYSEVTDANLFTDASRKTIKLIGDSRLAHKYLKCSATVIDGWTGTTVSSSSLETYYLNTKPDDFFASVDRTTAKVGNTIVCSGATTDKDSDSLTTSSQWFVATSANGTYSLLSGEVSDSYVVKASEAHKFIRCKRLANDGFGGVTTSGFSDTATIVDTAPVLTFNCPASSFDETANISSSYTISDADGDTINVTLRPGSWEALSISGTNVQATGNYDHVRHETNPARNTSPSGNSWTRTASLTLDTTYTNTALGNTNVSKACTFTIRDVDRAPIRTADYSSTAIGSHFPDNGVDPTSLGHDLDGDAITINASGAISDVEVARYHSLNNGETPVTCYRYMNYDRYRNGTFYLTANNMNSTTGSFSHRYANFDSGHSNYSVPKATDMSTDFHGINFNLKCYNDGGGEVVSSAARMYYWSAGTNGQPYALLMMDTADTPGRSMEDNYIVSNHNIGISLDCCDLYDGHSNGQADALNENVIGFYRFAVYDNFNSWRDNSLILPGNSPLKFTSASKISTSKTYAAGWNVYYDYYSFNNYYSYWNINGWATDPFDYRTCGDNYIRLHEEAGGMAYGYGRERWTCIGLQPR
jgi:hypothetical protein